MSEVNIAQLEKQLEESIAAKKTLEQLHRLFGNRDFKELILNQFCEKEVARQIRVSVGIRDPQTRADAIAGAQAAGHLLSWLNSLEQNAIQLVKDIPNYEADLITLRAEEGAEAEGLPVDLVE